MIFFCTCLHKDLVLIMMRKYCFKRKTEKIGKIKENVKQYELNIHIQEKHIKRIP